MQAGRGQVLVNSLLQYTKTEPDLVVVSLEGDLIPTHRYLWNLNQRMIFVLITSVQIRILNRIGGSYQKFHILKSYVDVLLGGLEVSPRAGKSF